MGNHTRLTWPDSFAVNYAYDALNRMSTATVNGGSQLAAYTYDPLSRRTALSYNSGSSAMAYTYSDAGDLLTLSNDLNGTANDVTFTNTYTNAHQLASEASSNADYVWVSPNTGSGDTYATVNTLNQYPSVNGGTVTWDTNGNLSTIAGATYRHDPENRMVRAVAPATTDTSYTYDPLGRRVAKAVIASSAPLWGTPNWNAFTWTAAATPTTTAFLHDGDNEIAEYNGSTLTRRSVPGAAIDEPIAMITAAGATTFFHTDRKGSVIAMADTSGARVEGPYTYDAYGNCFVGASTSSCSTLATTTEPFRYTGQRFDAETGLYYYRARLYHPGIGRFAEIDPAGYKPDINWYSAFSNDPTDKTDPTGLADQTGYLSNLGYTDYGGFVASPDEAKGIERGERALPGVLAIVVLETAPVTGTIMAARDFAKSPTIPNAVILAASLADAGGIAKAAKAFSLEKAALIDMAKMDSRLGILEEDLQAYQDLNAGLPDPFPPNMVRLDPPHLSRSGPASRVPHAHVGPVGHIPIRKKPPAGP